MNTLSKIGQNMQLLLYRRKSVYDPRYRSGLLSWILKENGWFTIVHVSVTFYDEKEQIVRFRNDLTPRFSKNQWQFEEQEQFKFELTALKDELNEEILQEIIEYSELARRQPTSRFDRHPPRFLIGSDGGDYGWTEKAWKHQKRNR